MRGRGRSRKLAFLLALAAPLAACKKTASGPTVVATETANDGSAMLEVDFGYEARGEREMDLVVNMRAIGVEQMDKIVVQVEVGDFHVSDGTAQWTGFVPPRDPKKFVVTLKAIEETDSPAVTVNISRSLDSQMLMSQTLEFVVENGQVRAAR